MKAAAPKKSLFSRVMALPSFKQARAKKPFVPTAKGKAKAKKLAASKKIPGLDVFDVMLESDAGSDSQKRRAQWFDKHLADLSEAQLCQMKRKVNTVCRRVL
ncbi:MAG: hypothetical protein KDK78_10395, partial [Chlamydiia bacterium]|nr:hypothetical protein [Chlamydiia bacterium]